MPHYDTYSPEIGLYGENGAVPVLSPSAEEAGKTRRPPASDKRDAAGKARPGHRTPGRARAVAKSEPTFMDKVNAFFHNPTLRVMTGLFLMLLAAYLLICFISYVGNCFDDQAVIAGTRAGTVHVDNYGGEGGARLSQILIDDGFGFGSLVIIFWLLMVSLKMLTNSRLGRFRTLNFTIKCLIALITISLIIGLLTIGLDVPFNLGGAHGRYVNQAIIDFIGWAGAALLCIFMLVMFVTICLRDVVKWCIKKNASAMPSVRPAAPRWRPSMPASARWRRCRPARWPRRPGPESTSPKRTPVPITPSPTTWLLPITRDSRQRSWTSRLT